MDHDSKARQKLAQRLDDDALTQAELARRTGISAVQLSHLLHGRRRPTLDQAVALEAEVGIAPKDWAP